MKKTYETPMAEKIEFRYEDQVVASNGVVHDLAHDGCTMQDPNWCSSVSAGQA